MNKEKNNKSAISGFDGVKAKCNQFIDSFAALCGGKDKMKVVLTVAGAVLCVLILLSTVMCSCASANTEGDSDEPRDEGIVSATEVITESIDDTSILPVPENGEWDEVLCSGDDYYLVKKEIDSFDGYKFMVGVVNSEGEWLREMTETGAFIDGVQFRAMGSSETLRDSSCYAYLGEGIFLASPGVSVFTSNEEFRVGSWENHVSYSPTGRADVSIWECLIWNVIDNSQKKFYASKMSVFHDGYALFCEEDELGHGDLNVINLKGEIVELDCQYLPNKPMHNFPVYSEGLFYACTEKSRPGFFDIEGNMIIDLSEFNVARIPYSAAMGVNSPYFENGQATILTTNNANSVFSAVIDKTGTIVGEPQKVDVPVY